VHQPITGHTTLPGHGILKSMPKQTGKELKNQLTQENSK
jgi:hypothetical protein